MDCHNLPFVLVNQRIQIQGNSAGLVWTLQRHKIDERCISLTRILVHKMFEYQCFFILAVTTLFIMTIRTICVKVTVAIINIPQDTFQLRMTREAPLKVVSILRFAFCIWRVDGATDMATAASGLLLFLFFTQI